MSTIQGRDKVYTIEKELGKGQYGITYLARDEYGSYYAIKKFKVESGGEASRDFEKEILSKILNICQNHAVCFVESLNIGNNFYIVMDYIEGKNINDLIFGKAKMILAKRIEAGYEFIRDLIIGLSKLHGLGLIHQDIKPENLMYSKGVVKYIDFGVSCLLSTAEEIDGYSVFGIGINEPCGMEGSRITAPPEIIGDLGLYSLVHLKGHDIWSVGCVILSWYIVQDNDFNPENHAYFQEFDNIEKYTRIFDSLKETDELAYQVVTGLLNRDPYKRIDNFNELVDYFTNPFPMFATTPDFSDSVNWFDKSVTESVKDELCDFRKSIKDEVKLPEIFIGTKKC